jgi:hypothetical protein
MHHWKSNGRRVVLLARSRRAFFERLLRTILSLALLWVPDWPDFAAAEDQTNISEVAQQHWSFRPIVEPKIPADDSAWGASPVDRFVRSKLRSAGLQPAAPADKRTLLRRATYDLTGLPPTPDETQVFLADESPEAFVKAVDRLMRSVKIGGD